MSPIEKKSWIRTWATYFTLLLSSHLNVKYILFVFKIIRVIFSFAKRVCRKNDIYFHHHLPFIVISWSWCHQLRSSMHAIHPCCWIICIVFIYEYMPLFSCFHILNLLDNLESRDGDSPCAIENVKSHAWHAWHARI